MVDARAEGDDDDWGDFVESPLPNKPALYNQNQGFSFNSNSNVIGSGLNGKDSNFDLFGAIYDNHNGLSSDSDLSKSRDLQSLGNGNLSGLSSNFDIVSVTKEFHSPRVKGSIMSFNSDFFAVENGIHSPQMKDTSVLDLNSYSFGHSRKEAESELFMSMDLFMGNNGSLLKANHPSSVHEEFGDWNFTDVYSERTVDKGNNNKVNVKEQDTFKDTRFSSQTDDHYHEPIFLSLASHGISPKPVEQDISFDLTQSGVAQKGFSFNRIETVAQNDLRSDSFVTNKQSGFDDEWFGDFQGASSGNGLKEEDVSKTDNTSHSKVEVLTYNGKVSVNETKTNMHNRALPLALFGEEEIETDNSPNAQDDFSYKPSFTRKDGINSEGSNYSIHDVISNLYSQAPQYPSVENPVKLAGNELNLNPSDEVPSFIPENFEDDFDDDSWEFKDASARTHALEISSHLDFYRKLEEELSFVCRCHVGNVKKARDTAAFSGEDTKVGLIEEEIQEACRELQEENSKFETLSENETLGEISLDGFLEVLLEPKFQVLESEYQLSRKLHLAQKDLTSAIEAMKHTKAKLNILTIGSSEDQYNYVSTWYKIISVCAQELKHGSWIWKQSIENNLRGCIISEPRGKDFMLSLGEIYRVAVVLGASAKLYKPWILSNSTAIFSLLEDCYSLWLSLRIEEALEALSFSDEQQSTATKLLKSIKHIQDFDELTLRDLVFSEHASVCRLSLLSTKVIPELKMVTWNGETYFVTLANLWLNLVNCNLPELPRMQLAS